MEKDGPPANMARECCRPRIKASKTGILSSRPKKGDDLRVLFMKGIWGVKRNA